MKILCVTNQALCKGDYLQQLQKIAAAKPDAMILREKQLSETAYQALAEQVQRICQEQGVQLDLSQPRANATRDQAAHLMYQLLTATGLLWTV